VSARVETARTLAGWPARKAQAADGFRRAIALAAQRGDAETRYSAAGALEQFARGERDAALEVEALRQEVDAAPKQLGSWERLAAASERQRAGAGAAVLRELVARWPAVPAAHLALSAHLAARGRANDAVAHLESVIRGGLDDALLEEERVRLDLVLRRSDDARAHQRELEARHAGEPAAQRGAARIALAEGRADAAADLLRDRASAESEVLRAQIELARGDLVAATAAVERAAALAPGFSASVERQRAAVHARAGEWPEALAALDRIADRGLALSADDELVRIRARYAHGEREPAKRALIALLADPQVPPDAAVEFAVREGSGDPERARAWLEQAQRGAPASYAVLEALTHLDLRSGEPARALARIEQVMAAQHTGARVLLLRAEVLESTGELARAEADALRALELAPDLPGAVDLAFSIYAAEHRLDLAQRAFEQADAAGALHGGARALLARIRLARGAAN
jgi:tetratricopeptide (TPR) repeat protein